MHYVRLLWQRRNHNMIRIMDDLDIISAFFKRRTPEYLEKTTDLQMYHKQTINLISCIECTSQLSYDRVHDRHLALIKILKIAK
jgi:hypothetical protein